MSIRDFQKQLEKKTSSDRMVAYRTLETFGAQRLSQEATLAGWEPWPQD